MLGPVGLVARALRWRYLFPPRSHPPGLVPATMIGYMVNNILPLRAGEVVRVYVVARRWQRGGSFWMTAATLIVERVLDSLFIVGLLGVLIFLVPVPPVVEWAAIVMLAVDVAGVSTLVAIAVAPEHFRRVVDLLTTRWPRAHGRAVRAFETFVDGLAGIRTPGHVLPLIGWTAVVWVIPAMAAWGGLKAVHLDLPWLAGWVILAFIGLGVSIPSAPGYIGVFHVAAKLATEIFGVSEPEALGYAIVFHATNFIPVTLIGWLFLLREHVTLGEATRASATGTEPGPPPR